VGCIDGTVCASRQPENCSDVGGSDHHNRARDPALRNLSSRRIDHKCLLLSLHNLAVCV